MRSGSTDLLSTFRDRAVTRGDELYLDTAQASELVEVATRRGVRVVGIECFEEVAGNLMPRLDLIADFSDATLTVANTAAQRFIAALPKTILCSFVLSD